VRYILLRDTKIMLTSENRECVTNNIAEAWAPLAQWLRCNGRKAFNTETGGGNTASCIKFMCQQIAYQAQNSDGELKRES
jgi:endoglucanase